ncbi:MAG: Asp-tRNA(Asn)/Glu-tRNA(Gln) amidotransferase subunit GatC [Actinobacteria bacterium]|nr:Asp-tRNA(Asn)/Glu-tRNA(Gln) amidotransferase subunit GatC [Actinomycetota bacterium]
MSAKIGPEQVRKVAHLARIKLSESEVEQFSEQLSDILTYVDQLNELDTSNVEPTTHPLRLSNVFRKDEAGETLSNEAALANAPKKHGGFFAVPKVLE